MSQWAFLIFGVSGYIAYIIWRVCEVRINGVTRVIQNVTGASLFCTTEDGEVLELLAALLFSELIV